MKRLHAIGWTLVTALLLSTVFGMVGCSSDPSTPHDDTQLTAEDVAHQSGFLAYSIVNVLPTMNSKAFPGLETLSGFSGDFWLDTGHVWTDAPDHVLTWTPSGFDFSVDCEFDITSVAGLANGTGTLTAGTLEIGFTIVDVTVVGSGYHPTSGQVLVSSGAMGATITFNGGTATVQVGTQSWTIDLSDGTLVS